eukprot:TRINITY_DN4106_c0_g1_i1.p1 TRINITY_DN4106_c0_g1~~TRINITY_DN4106_c0_g1_i1.p1  ORF type:complete len:121 (-),score=2.71 TRINITY_DN4106_c0_g1_i1:111-473(-)
MGSKELRKIVGPDIVIVIAGNKCDLERQRQVTAEEAQKYAESVGATHFPTSAKLGRGVEQAFMDLTKKMLAKKPADDTGKRRRNMLDDEPIGGSSSAPRKGQLRVVSDDEIAQKKEGGCC